MKRLTLVSFAALLCLNSFSQKPDKMEINYSDPLQVDSSAFFLIPKLVDNDNRSDYGKGKGYLPWYSYSDIYFYNTSTNQSTKLFGSQLALIVPFNENRRYERANNNEPPANFLDNHIVYMARTENFNGDNALDTEDPVYLYISTKTGEGLRQLTPKGMNVVSWTLSKDKKVILVKLQQDKNGNKKFGEGDDEVYYRIDLTPDITAIKCYPLSL